jgi:hypothetical protein
VRTALLLALASGCSSWRSPTDFERRDAARAHPGIDRPMRLQVRLDVESPWLSGQFAGVVLARPGPEVRAQFFPDIGGKAIDLLATPRRIAGYFPMSREGIDCRLPEEARPHPLLFMGLHLLERVAPLAPERVTGWKRVEGDLAAPEEARATSIVAGASLELVFERLLLSIPRLVVHERRFRWMYGIGWTERREGSALVAEASRVRIRVEVLEREPLESVPASHFELALPPDVKRAGR